MGLERVDADPTAGFHYPYLLHIPDHTPRESPPIFVEPPNMPGPSDDFDAHRQEATQRAQQGFGRRVADELNLPFLHPIFPRPESDPVDWTHYTHQLCRKTLQIDTPPLARIDEQLLAMVEDARTRLTEHNHDVAADIVVNGFSASGTFAHRFSVLHPDHVAAVSAGGLNGMTVLPLESTHVERMGGARTLNYPVGIADLETLTGQSFDLDAFREVDQFLYMGADDRSDSLRYPDAWTEPEIRASAVMVYGEDIHRDRFPYCQSVYDDHDIPAVFRRYDDTGHTPEPAFEDIVEFHKRSLDDDDPTTPQSAFGDNVSQ